MSKPIGPTIGKTITTMNQITEMAGAIRTLNRRKMLTITSNTAIKTVAAVAAS